MKKLIAFVLTAVMLAGTAAVAYADDAVTDEAVAEPLVIDGMTQVVVTTSDASHDVDVSNFFDSVQETKCVITFDAAEETKTFSVYTATRVPEAISSFATILDGEKGTVVTIEAYGTNDSLLFDWDPLAIEVNSLDTEYAIFSVNDNETAYAFYRFDFTLEIGEYFEIAELALYKVTTDEPEMIYDLGDSIEAGETPALIPIEEAAIADVDEVEESEDVPTFGLFSSFPMPKYKFLPRG